MHWLAQHEKKVQACGGPRCCREIHTPLKRGSACRSPDVPGAVLIKRLVALEGDWLYVPGRADVQKIPKARLDPAPLLAPKLPQRTRQLMRFLQLCLTRASVGGTAFYGPSCDAHRK